MTEEQILKKAIAKAKKNGYRFLNIIYDGVDTLDGTIEDKLYYRFIFSHDFAKAFFGECKEWLEKIEGVGFEYVNELPSEETLKKVYWITFEEAGGWQYHIQRMVLEKEPLKYLEQFLNK